MKNNYPIKYALVPMIEQVGWTHGLHELERENEIICYIVSKCYLIKEEKRYKQNGAIENKYHVVCPFAYNEFDTWKKTEPSFNLLNGSCTNEIVTDKVYNSFEEAKIAKEQKNKDIFNNRVMYINYKKFIEKYDELKREYNNKIMYYDQLETLIESKLQDLQLENTFKEQNIIISTINNTKKSEVSLYEAIDIFNIENFIVYSVSYEEYLELQKNIGNEKINNKFNHTPLLINNKKIDVIQIILPNQKVKYLYNNEILDSIDFEFIVPKKYTAIIYTIEDYKDILKSYSFSNKDDKIIKLIKRY